MDSYRPANSHGFAVCFTVFASISRSHEFLFISHGFSKTYFQFTNAAIFKMFRFYSAFPLQILCMILCTISLFCVIVLESHHSAADIAGWLKITPSAPCPASRSLFACKRDSVLQDKGYSFTVTTMSVWVNLAIFCEKVRDAKSSGF